MSRPPPLINPPTDGTPARANPQRAAASAAQSMSHLAPRKPRHHLVRPWTCQHLKRHHPEPSQQKRSVQRLCEWLGGTSRTTLLGGASVPPTPAGLISFGRLTRHQTSALSTLVSLFILHFCPRSAVLMRVAAGSATGAAIALLLRLLRLIEADRTSNHSIGAGASPRMCIMGSNN